VRSSECSIGRTKRAPERRVRIVAEFTNNHLGDIERLRRMVQRTAEAGADFVKVQKRDVDTFYSTDQLLSPYSSPFGKTLGDYRRGVELTREGFEALDEECRRCSIDWFCSVLDYASYHFISQFGPKLLKLPSTVSERRDFLRQIGSEHRGDLVVSTGFTNTEYEEFVQRHFPHSAHIYLLQTNSAYPTAPFECGVAVIRHYRDLARQDSRIIPGYSSHDLGSLGSMLAVAAGAQMVEKHVKLGNTAWVHFDHVAVDLEGDDFTNYVKDVRLAEDICGDETKRIHRGEHHKYSALEPTFVTSKAFT
jgi:sialic acid synthase SpsE